jgi:hypothetical protein
VNKQRKTISKDFRRTFLQNGMELADIDINILLKHGLMAARINEELLDMYICLGD